MAMQPGCTNRHLVDALEGNSKRSAEAPAQGSMTAPPRRPEHRAAPMSHHPGQADRHQPPAPLPPGDRVRLDTALDRSWHRHRLAAVSPWPAGARGSPCGLSPSTGVHKSGARQPAEGVLSVALSIGRLQGPRSGPLTGCKKASVAQPHSFLALALAGLWEVGRLV